MRVLTLTTQYANNYGALLQCYALSRFLNDQEEIECRIINYLPSSYKRSWIILRRPKSVKEFAKIVYSMLNLPFVFDKKAKNKLMHSFIKNYLPLTEKVYNRDSILFDPPKADAYICGSDQIWNELILRDLTYYLDFVKDDGCKRIAYAASIAEPWSDEFEKRITPLLNRFNNISLREKGNIPQAQAIVNHLKINWVLDPVFLLERNVWEKLAREPEIDDPFIFCYFMNVSQLSINVVNKLRKLTGYRVITLGVDSLDKFKSDKVVRRLDPFDFIGYIKKADFVCTNSFHCSAFSIIFEKRFVCMPRNRSNERIISLQEVFGIEIMMNKQKYDKLTVDSFCHNYSKSYEKGSTFIKESKDFLLKSLYE